MTPEEFLNAIKDHDLSIVKAVTLELLWLCGQFGDRCNVIGQGCSDVKTGCIDGYLLDFTTSTSPEEAVATWLEKYAKVEQ